MLVNINEIPIEIYKNLVNKIKKHPYNSKMFIDIIRKYIDKIKMYIIKMKLLVNIVPMLGDIDLKHIVIALKYINKAMMRVTCERFNDTWLKSNHI